MMLKRLLQPIPSALRCYFASGWAFLIPYQLAYLLYYWRQWPSNPGTETATKTAIPSLLVVYWAMHALHIALALLTSASAKIDEGMVNGEENTPGGDDQGQALHRHQLRAMSCEPLATIIRRFLSLFPLHSFVFWVILALLFYIPGVYLEFPSDPWEHLRRINEWKAHEVVHWHEAGYKSLYFFAYSLVGWIRVSSQMPALNFYYTGMCLLLSSQYYLLARAAGLPKRWAQGFVLLHLLIAGNVSFSFFRYYAMASTAFSQLGAIVLIRLTIYWTKQKKEKRRVKGESPATAHTAHICRVLVGLYSLLSLHSFPVRSPFSLHFSLFVSALCAALLVVNNHVQGLGIAALGCASVFAWKLVGWPRRPWTGRLILISVLVGGSFATYQLWPRSPKFAALIPQGWITPWYGFSLLAPASPAFDRMIQILGGFGLLNLAAGIFLITRRQLAGWLTLFPVLILALPIGAIPLADKIIRGDNIIIYHRVFFAIPTGLALVALLRELILRRQTRSRREVLAGLPSRATLSPAPFTFHALSSRFIRPSPFALTLAGLLAISIIPASNPWFNRTWQVLAQVPEDLSLLSIWQDLAQVQSQPQVQGHEPKHSAHSTLTEGSPALRAGEPTPYNAASALTIHADHTLTASMALSFVFNTQNPSQKIGIGYNLPDGKGWVAARHYGNSALTPSDEFDAMRNAIARPDEFLTIAPTVFFTPYSQAALCSGHWIPQEGTLATSGILELRTLAQAKSMQPYPLPHKTTLWKPAKE